jgi:Zn-dependent protease
MDKLTEGMLWYLVFLLSTTAHEAAHAFTAMKLGDRTAYQGGQVTLDPVPHIKREPLGMVVMPILSFLTGGWMIGWASTPYDPQWAHRYPKRSAWMSLAGPAANLSLVLLAALTIRIGMALHIFHAPQTVNALRVTLSDSEGALSFIAMLLSLVFTLNLILFVFNMIPLPPLDGSGALPLLLDEELARRYTNAVHHARFGFIGLLIAWQLFGAVYRPIRLLALNLLYPGAGYH